MDLMQIVNIYIYIFFENINSHSIPLSKFHVIIEVHSISCLTSMFFGVSFLPVPRLARKKSPRKSNPGKIMDWKKLKPSPFGCSGNTVTSTIFCVRVASNSGSFGRASNRYLPQIINRNQILEVKFDAMCQREKHESL